MKTPQVKPDWNYGIYVGNGVVAENEERSLLVKNETLTFDKQNWSGETATIKVKDKKFEYYGYQFELKERATKEESWITNYVDVFVDGSLDYTLIEIDGEYYYEDDCGDFERSHKNPAILTAIIASNLL